MSVSAEVSGFIMGVGEEKIEMSAKWGTGTSAKEGELVAEVRGVLEEMMTGTSAKGKELAAEVREAVAKEVRGQVYSLRKEQGRVQAGVIREVQVKLIDKPGDVGARDLPNIFNLKSLKIDKSVTGDKPGITDSSRPDKSDMVEQAVLEGTGPITNIEEVIKNIDMIGVMEDGVEEYMDETLAGTLDELTRKEGTEPITLSDKTAKKDKQYFAMDKEGGEEVGMVGEQTEYENIDKGAGVEEYVTRRVVETLDELTGREGTGPITLGDKTAKEDTPHYAMDREGGEEGGMVGEQTEYKVKKTLTCTDRDLMGRKRKLSSRLTSTSTSGGNLGSSSATTSTTSTSRLSTTTGTNVMDMVKEWSRRGADQPDQSVRGKSEINTIKYLFKKTTTSDTTRMTTVRARIETLEGTVLEEPRTPPPFIPSTTPMYRFGGSNGSCVATGESPLKKRRVDPPVTTTCSRPRSSGLKACTPRSTRCRHPRLTITGQKSTLLDGQRAPGMTVPTSSSPTRDPLPPGATSGTTSRRSQRELMDHNHHPSPLPPGRPLPAEPFMGYLLDIKSSSSSSSESSAIKNMNIKGGNIKSRLKIAKSLSTTMSESSSSSSPPRPARSQRAGSSSSSVSSCGPRPTTGEEPLETQLRLKKLSEKSSVLKVSLESSQSSVSRVSRASRLSSSSSPSSTARRSRSQRESCRQKSSKLSRSRSSESSSSRSSSSPTMPPAAASSTFTSSRSRTSPLGRNPGRSRSSSRLRSKSGRDEKHTGARGPPLECERSAYLLCPGPEADTGQMRMHLPSSASSSPPGRRSIFLGSGLGLTGEWDGGGGGAISAKVLNFTNYNSFLCTDKPGLPRSAARPFDCKEDDKPNLAGLGSGERRFRAGNTSSIEGPAEQIPGNTSTRDQHQPSLGNHLLEKGGARDSSSIAIQN